jgi:hypothetical protein
MTWRVVRLHRAGGWLIMKRMIGPLAMALLLATSAIADTEPTTPGEVRQGALGTIGVTVDDGMGYGDGTAAARTPAYIVQALMASGLFVSAETNRFEWPQQLRVKIRKKPVGSEDAAAAQVIVGAATLFLLPMKQAYYVTFEFEVECRGRLMGTWTNVNRVEQTQFLLADPHVETQALVKGAVADFIRQAAESGKLASGCV